MLAFDTRRNERGALSLVRILAHTVFAGVIAGLLCGLLLANTQPLLQTLLSAENSGARLAFLIVCLQVGAAVALPIAMLPGNE